MKLKGLNDYDICNYKKPSMFLIFPYCSFKCDKEFGTNVCQNSALAKEPIIEIDIKKLVFRYITNPLTQAIVCGGLEPFDSFEELYAFICVFRAFSNDPVIIYTGYNKDEVIEYLSSLQKIKNIIVKFGRYIPNSPPKYDEILGVELASNN